MARLDDATIVADPVPAAAGVPVLRPRRTPAHGIAEHTVAPGHGPAPSPRSSGLPACGPPGGSPAQPDHIAARIGPIRSVLAPAPSRLAAASRSGASRVGRRPPAW